MCRKIFCNLAQLLFDPCQSSEYLVHFLLRNFFCNKLRCSCYHFVLSFHRRQFLLNILKKCLKKYFGNSIHAFTGFTSLFSRDKRYIFQLPNLFWLLILGNTGSQFKCMKTAKGYWSVHLNMTWNSTESNIQWDSVLEILSRNVTHRIHWFISAIQGLYKKAPLVRQKWKCILKWFYALRIK